MKSFVYTGVLAVACSLSLFGDGNDSDGSIKQSKSIKNSKEPPAFDADLYRRDVQCFSLHGEFLFWRVQEGALDYALAMKESAWGPTQCYAQGNFENATFNGDPGFRVSMNFFRAPKFWEFWTQYTRLTATGDNTSSKPFPNSEFLTGTWPQIFTNPMASANSFLHLNYNVADVYVTRVFFPNPHLRLRMLGGGTVAWMDQFWKIIYADSSFSQTKITNRWSFIGGGLKTGTTFDWYWFTDIYMTGGVSLTGYLGSYHNSAFQKTNFQPTGAFNPSLPVRNAYFQDIRPALQGQFYLGPSYQKNFTNQRLEIFVGYELNAWLNLQEIYRSTNGLPTDAKETWINSSMLALQGLNVRASLDF